MIKNFLNPEGHKNPISGTKLMAILLKGWTCDTWQVTPDMEHLTPDFLLFGATVRIHQEIQFLLYARFFKTLHWKETFCIQLSTSRPYIWPIKHHGIMCNFEKKSFKPAKRNLLGPFCQSIQIISKIEEKKFRFLELFSMH